MQSKRVGTRKATPEKATEEFHKLAEAAKAKADWYGWKRYRVKMVISIVRTDSGTDPKEAKRRKEGKERAALEADQVITGGFREIATKQGNFQDSRNTVAGMLADTESCGEYKASSLRTYLTILARTPETETSQFKLPNGKWGVTAKHGIRRDSFAPVDTSSNLNDDKPKRRGRRRRAAPDANSAPPSRAAEVIAEAKTKGRLRRAVPAEGNTHD